VGCEPRRAATRLEVGRPTAAEQRELWLAELGEAGAELDGQGDALTAQFDLSEARIRASVGRRSVPPAMV
jgi:hypothetical protein